MSTDTTRPERQHWAEVVAECVTDEQEALRIVGLYEDGEWQPEMLAIGRENLALKRDLTVAREQIAAMTADRDMAAVGRALLDVTAKMCPDWAPADCPSEIVSDLVNARDEALSERDAARARVAELEAIAAMLDAVVQGAQEEFVRVPYGASHEDLAQINDWHKMAREARALLSPSPEPQP